jgi:hypothetical protein
MKFSSTIAAAVALLLAHFPLQRTRRRRYRRRCSRRCKFPSIARGSREPATVLCSSGISYRPGNADPVRDGFTPLERIAVLVLYIGGDGR